MLLYLVTFLVVVLATRFLIMSNTQQPESTDSLETGELLELGFADVFVVKDMLAKGLHLPVGVVDTIMDYAEYWVHSTTMVDFSNQQLSYFVSNNRNKLVLRTRPIGFFKKTHPDPALYRSQEIQHRELEKEHSVEIFQKWIAAPEHIVSHPVRKIVFTFSCRDQGWGGDPADWGTFSGSWTWFDVGLERFDANAKCTEDCPHGEQSELFEKSDTHPMLPVCALRSIIPPVQREDDGVKRIIFDTLPNDMMLQCNRTVHDSISHYRIEWACTDAIDPASPEAEALSREGRGKATGNGEFVRSLKLGDVVTVWAKARFPGWANQIEKFRVDVCWSI